MNSPKRNVIIIILFLSFSFLLAIADRAPIHLEKDCPCVHLKTNYETFVFGVVMETSSGPYVYRVFIPYLAYYLQSVLQFLTLVDIDLILKIFFLFVSQLVFFKFLQNFYSDKFCFTGVLLVDILLSFTFSSIIGPSIGENADLLNMIIFILALRALYKDSFIPFLIVLFVGTFNRESTWFLLPILLINDLKLKKGIVRTIIASVVFLIPYLGLRIVIQPPDATWFSVSEITRNIPFLSPETTQTALIANLHTIFLLLPFIILSFLNFKKHILFLRISLYVVPLFILIHYIFGSIIETRLWIPLFVILIPASLDTLNIIFGTDITSKEVLTK